MNGLGSPLAGAAADSVKSAGSCRAAGADGDGCAAASTAAVRLLVLKVTGSGAETGNCVCVCMGVEAVDAAVLLLAEVDDGAITGAERGTSPACMQQLGFQKWPKQCGRAAASPVLQRTSLSWRN